ncbi:MAG TPA: LysR family transcriptional regulator [Candidatus Sulfotelmatobacter sp.]|nr:LysR family transcriptional regulator [Candidatus Sulfotelmatobacter sp.]
MDRLAGITAFVRVAESGGFSAAARHLNVSTSTVSDQVQALENTLGVRLLNRTTRRVSLTEIGRDYYERCAQILQELAEADEAAGALQVTPRGRLRVYCHQGLSRFIGLVVPGFLGDYPEVSLDLRTGDAMIDLVQEGFDLAIMPMAPPDSTVIKRTLAKWRYVVCCAPAYLEAHPAPRNPADLADHNCLLYAYSVFGPELPFIDEAGNPATARVSGNLLTTSIGVMRATALAGLGVWMCPPYVVSDLLASGALVPLLTEYARPEMEIVALYPHRRQLSAKVRLFLDRLVDRFAEEQRWVDAPPDR